MLTTSDQPNDELQNNSFNFVFPGTQRCHCSRCANGKGGPVRTAPVVIAKDDTCPRVIFAFREICLGGRQRHSPTRHAHRAHRRVPALAGPRGTSIPRCQAPSDPSAP